jgi:hypothetical protein
MQLLSIKGKWSLMPILGTKEAISATVISIE